MFIVKAPVRISFFGGGTDVEDWFVENGGTVLSTSINQYCYVLYKPNILFKDYNFRAVYSKIEMVDEVDNLDHPLIRAVLKHYNCKSAEVVYDADTPASSGLGTSSAFAVGLIAAILASRGHKIEQKLIADTAIHIEREVLREAGGWQDQIAAAYGGLNEITFKKVEKNYYVQKLIDDQQVIDKFFSTLILCKVGGSRYGFTTSFANNFNIKRHGRSLDLISKATMEGKKALLEHNWKEFGSLLHEAWQYKKSLGGVTNTKIDDMYTFGLENGAWGGKLLGAGMAGFMMFMVPTFAKEKFIKRLDEFDIKYIEPGYESAGVQILNR